MKRLLHIQFLLVLLLALGYSPLQAKRITQWQAQQQAYSFWGKQMPQKAKAKSRTATTASPSDAYYVFNNDAGGFVIIAGDDAVTPVLGYTSTGSFDAENLPDGLKDLLKSYERQIAALGDSYQANQTATRAAFTGEKLLNTAKWNQYAPFNKYTPNNYVTGCVATAGAIVMKHHGYPAKGIGSHSYTWNGQTLSASFEHTYDWANMPAEYDGTNDAAFDGVARLMSDLGVAVEMKYAADGSGSYIGDLVTALQKYYGYSKLSHLMAIEDVGAEAWNGRLRDEIDANRPVLYAASDPNTGGGHAFVIDGYKDESFSVNWGWGGYCDGFYKIGALNPESEGNPTGDKYNVGQSAVFGMEPSGGMEKVSTMGFKKLTNQLQTLNMNITDVKKGQRGTIFSAPIGNTGDHNFNGEIAVALMNAKGEIRETVTRQPFKLTDFAPGYYYTSLSFSIESTVDAEPGDYLAMVAKEGSEEYIELYDPDFERKRLPATGYKPLTYEIRTKVGEGATIKQAETWYNPSTNFYNGKPVIGANYCYYLTLDAGIANCCVELNGKLVNDINLGTESPNSFRGIEPVYTLEVKTYRNYQEKDITINLTGAGTLKQALAKENPDYFVYRNIKVNGEIDKRDFDELASHYFKSIDLSGAKVVAYDGYKADMVPDYAFEANEYLESFKMPACVKELGFNAFRATMLKEIDLPETIEEFGRNTFNACFYLTDVYMRHKEPPYWISWCVFASKFDDLYRTLHLYPGSKAKYEAHSYTKNWIKYFDNVVEDLEPTGIHSVTLDENTAPKAIYDLNGRRIQNVPFRGIYIQNGKKISVK
ncbi:C10 family peptidase [Segatella copri]|uniref:C10 family peptidase n=1 Tax=Segatella copri TaxID=165179 RepID=UPI0012915A43|nr:C10 family peptidase [Segatella copri]MQN14564.1 leucine-rich repeat protein [Segatella copri]MQN19257.1 leucine-rich repeat protein [Segatella copri]